MLIVFFIFYQQRLALLQEEKKCTFAPSLPVRASFIAEGSGEAPVTAAPVFDRLNTSKQYMQNILSQVTYYSKYQRLSSLMTCPLVRLLRLHVRMLYAHLTPVFTSSIPRPSHLTQQLTCCPLMQD